MATVKAKVTTYISPENKGRVRRGCSPYLHELALTVISWNSLHQELALLFWNVTGITGGAVPLSIWYSTDNDRAQRKLLREALKAGGVHNLSRPRKEPMSWCAKAVQDIEFILNEADRISGPRNDFIHSPFAFVREDRTITMTAFDFFGNPRAKPLVGKDLLKEFRRHRKISSILAAYAQRARLALYIEPPLPWPDRPSLPPPAPRRAVRDRLIERAPNDLRGHGDAAHPMLPHLGQGANQSIEDGMALATILANDECPDVSSALLAYERLRRERVAEIQRGARQSGLRYDSACSDLGVRDAEIRAHAAFRRTIYDYDVVPLAQASVTSPSPSLTAVAPKS